MKLKIENLKFMKMKHRSHRSRTSTGLGLVMDTKIVNIKSVSV